MKKLFHCLESARRSTDTDYYWTDLIAPLGPQGSGKGYVAKVFALGSITRRVHSHRPQARIPTRPLFLSLLMGAVLRLGSYLDIAKQTKRRRWQHLIHWNH